MDLVLWVIFGGIAGWIGSILIKLPSPKETVIMVTYGIIGGMVGGGIADILCNESMNTFSTFNIYSVLSAVLVGSLIPWIHRILSDHDT